MKRILCAPLILLAVIFLPPAPAQAQSLLATIEELKVELRALSQAGQLNATPFIKPLARIYDLEEELRPTGHESQLSMGARCERIIKVNKLYALVERLKHVRVRARRARERLKPLLDRLESAVRAYGPGDDGSCQRLKDTV